MSAAFIRRDLQPLLRFAAPGYGLLLILALAAFWPGYVAVPKRELGFWVHFHAIAATLWLLLLITQPVLIATGRSIPHRVLGRAAVPLGIAVIAGFIGLTHQQLAAASAQEFPVQAYFAYVRLVLVALFATCFALGVMHRRDPARHARYMFCSGLAAIDPVVHRLLARALDNADLNYQLYTFGLACIALLALIIAERRASAGRRVFPAVMAAIIIGTLPLTLNFYEWKPVWSAWKDVVARFAALPIP